MKQQNITAAGDWTKKQYRLVDRFLPLSGAPLEWPLLLTIIRRVAPQKKSVAELTREALLKEYAPAGVLVDHLGNICYVHGHTGLFLEPAQGYYGLSNVLKMARKKLRRDLNTTLYKAVTTQLAGESPLLSVKRNGETINLKIRVVPLLKKASMDQDFYLIIFDQRPDQKAQPVLTDSIAESINPLPVNRELMRINHVIETKEMELSSLNNELETTRRELEISRDKLNVVKANIQASETELLTLCEKVDESKDALQILSAELFDARSELEANQPVAEIITPELNPVREELATLKNEFILMNQTLDDKKEVLGKLDATPNTTADWPLAVDLKAVGEPEKELLFNNAAEFQAAANHGYRHDNEIKSVHIPEGVEVVKRSMFYKCTQLETVTFPSTLKAIEDFAFYGCEALKQIDLNRCKVLEVIGTSAFEGCKSMAGLVIPDAVIAIEEAAFLGCQGLETVEFPGDSQLEVLGSHAFKDCEKIKSIILPEQLKHIGISCFYSCKKLFEIHLPRELETVGEYAFFGCNALEKINLPNKKIVKQPGFSIGFPEGVKI
ncbi:leucine-rich repeat protein [Acetobacterium sp.]|uniref:leucine-rich repeat protein n=1 Tax=Acetobacterium sp. TaxID=1872094 RepID=UPI00271E3936|nr:leucine-rich repeat protein [Acetobacterium sp.]MDO9492610.1 leucine-rich repeat protein [Acetobacterium sp.]